MKISIKLSHTELLSLVSYLEAIIASDESTSRKEAIITILVLRLYKKLKEKCTLLEPRNYSFAVPPETAMAFVEYFAITPLITTSHAGNVIRKLIALFDQQTSNYY